jgi:hemerythrin-like metal-binding protein
MPTPSNPYIASEEIPSVRVAVLDNQHRQIAERLIGLHEAVEAGKPRGVVLARLTGLYNEMRSHFSTEEQILRLHKIPDLTRHKAAHEGLAETLALVRQQVASGEREMNQGVVELMKLWLLDHMEEFDCKYAKLLETPDESPNTSPTEDRQS